MHSQPTALHLPKASLRTRSLFPSLLAVVVLLIYCLKVLSSHQWDPIAFVLLRPSDIPSSQTWGVGYDGRFTHALAVNPLGSTENLDQPAYRYQRILYPLLTRAASFGQVDLVPWAMLGINLAAAALGCVALGKLLRQQGASPWFALVFSLSLGYLLTIRMDLSEPLAFAFAFWGWLFYYRDRRVLAVVLFALGGLTKEVALVFPVVLAAWEALHKNFSKCGFLILFSLSPYLAWYIFLSLWLGITETQVAQSSLLWIPFSGVRYLGDPVSLGLAGIWVLGPALLAGLFAAWDIVRDPRGQAGLSGLMVLAQAALVAIMPAPTWGDPLAILRVGLGLLAAILVWLASSRPRALPFAAALWLPSALVLFLVPGLL